MKQFANRHDEGESPMEEAIGRTAAKMQFGGRNRDAFSKEMKKEHAQIIRERKKRIAVAARKSDSAAAIAKRKGDRARRKRKKVSARTKEGK